MFSSFFRRWLAYRRRVKKRLCGTSIGRTMIAADRMKRQGGLCRPGHYGLTIGLATPPDKHVDVSGLAPCLRQGILFGRKIREQIEMSHGYPGSDWEPPGKSPDELTTGVRYADGANCPLCIWRTSEPDESPGSPDIPAAG